jgi:biopolymer transport protein ExbB
LARFWGAPSLEAATAQLKAADTEGPFASLASAAIQASQLPQDHTSLNARVDPSELLTRTLRQQINQASAQLESGLTMLASIGSTAPFVGLLGTVWGIYHALLNIAGTGQIAIDKIAGPVGEALIMTALGLAVAIPAVLAYNAFARANRLTLAELDGFAHDLHAYLTTGTRVGK